MPTGPSQGDTWKSNATIMVPGGNVAVVPLTVTARSVAGRDVALSAHGQGSGTLRGRGPAIRVAIDIALDETFHDGRLVDAADNRTMSAHVFFRSMSMIEKWAVSAIEKPTRDSDL